MSVIFGRQVPLHVSSETVMTDAQNIPAPFAGNRDLVIDFIRGFAMLLVLINHFPNPSYFYLLTVDRIGVVTGAELFVIISGLVLGTVHRQRIETYGWRASATGLFKRGAQIYLAIIGVTLAVWFFDALPFVNLESIMTWTDPSTKTVYTLIPKNPLEHPTTTLNDLLRLRITPSQINILGFFVLISAVAPFALWLLMKRRLFLLLGISWTLYSFNFWWRGRITSAAFENPFPLLSWQLPFINALVFGYFRREVSALFTVPLRRAFVRGALAFVIVVIFYTWNNPWYAGFQYDRIPKWARLAVIPPDVFDSIYASVFGNRTWLYTGRLIDAAAIIFVLYIFLCRFWEKAYRTAGWFFVPIGQASLYVFIMHVVLVPVLSLVPAETPMWIHTLSHMAALLLLWAMVKRRFLFWLIPR